MAKGVQKYETSFITFWHKVFKRFRQKKKRSFVLMTCRWHYPQTAQVPPDYALIFMLILFINVIIFMKKYTVAYF